MVQSNSQISYDSVKQLVANEIAHPCPGRHRDRWARIKEIEANLNECWKDKPQDRKSKKTTAPFYETTEWKALSAELRHLLSIERTHALSRNWPIWQQHQHCRYLDANGTLREAEVISFDLDNDTIECTTWELHDILGYLNAQGRRTPATITVKQIYDAIQREKADQLARNEQQRALKIDAERQSLPLFAAQID